MSVHCNLGIYLCLHKGDTNQLETAAAKLT